jgi:hypothetical protein
MIIDISFEILNPHFILFGILYDECLLNDDTPMTRLSIGLVFINIHFSIQHE